MSKLVVYTGELESVITPSGKVFVKDTPVEVSDSLAESLLVSSIFVLAPTTAPKKANK
jgi:hypothetical protein